MHAGRLESCPHSHASGRPARCNPPLSNPPPQATGDDAELKSNIAGRAQCCTPAKSRKNQRHGYALCVGKKRSPSRPRIVLSGADLSGADLRDADLSDAVLRDADLSGADLSDADLSGVLRGAVLRCRPARCRPECRPERCRPERCRLRDADLRGAVLRDADLRGAVLRDAVLRDADLSGADGNQLPRATPAQTIENLDKVRAIVADNRDRLNMGQLARR